MTTYATKKQVAGCFGKSTRTIQRWIDDDKKIVFDRKEFKPEKDPGGNWRFIVKLL